MSLFGGKRLAAVATMTVGLLMAAAPAHAWYVDISITGAGRVYETTDANELDEHCPDAIEGFASPASTPTGVLGATCRAGDASGDYGHGWVVRYVAEPAAGYRFAGWESDGRTTPGPVACDGSDGSPNHAGPACQFATFQNLQTRAVFVDDTAPSMASLSGPIGQVNGSATFTFSAAADPTFSHFQCRLVNGAESQLHDWQTCSSGHQENPAPAGTEGTYKLYTRAVDRSSNPSAASSWSWTVDKLAPETTLDSGSGPSGLTTTRSATFSFSGSSDVTGYMCALDGVAASCQSPKTYSDLGDGTHTFQVWARDDASNADLSPATRTWVVDTVAPDTTITDGPAEETTSPNQSATFAFSSTESGTLECQLDSTGWTACESPRSYIGLSEGPHTFAVRARDQAGNVDPSPATHAWTVDTTAPQTSVLSGPANNAFVLSTGADLSFGSTEPGSSFTCALDGVGVTCPGGSVSLTDLSHTTHSVTGAATDGTGNTDATPAVRSWTVPLNNTALTHSTGWSKKSASGSYLGTYSQTTRKGATLSRKVIGAKKLALVATKGLGYGKVQVFAGSRLLKTVSLAASSRQTKQLVPVTTFASPFTGKLKVVVSTSGKTVRIEGLGVAN